MFNAIKDRVVSTAARSQLNAKIARYGVVQSLELDSSAKRASAVVMLEGETTPVTLEVKNYLVTEQGGEKFIEITATACSRRWVARLLEDHVHGKRFKLPPWASSAL